MKAQVRQFCSELKDMKKGTRLINEYVLRIKPIVDSLVAIGDAVSEQEHIDVILEGLPEAYGLFMMMIYGRVNNPSVIDIESLLLLQEAQHEKFKTRLSSGSVTVNVAQEPNNQNSNKNDSYGQRWLWWP